MSLAPGMGSWRIHTGHPKHATGLRQAGLLLGHGKAKTGDTYFYHTGRKGVRPHLAAARPRGHKAQGGATELQAM